MIYQEVLDEHTFDGNQLLAYSITNNINIYGNLSTLLLSTDYVKKLSFPGTVTPNSMQQLSLLYELLYSAKILYTYIPLVSTILTPAYNDTKLLNNFQKYFSNTPYPILPQRPTNLTNFTQTQHYVMCKKILLYIYRYGRIL